MRNVENALEITISRPEEVERLHHDCGELTFVLGQKLIQRVKVVIRKCVRQLANRCRNARGAGRASNVPVLPAMVPANGDSLALGKCACSTHRSCRGIRPVLAILHHLGARDDARKALREFNLERMGERKAMPLGRLLIGGAIYVGVGVPEDVWQQALNEVNVFVVVDVPYVSTGPMVKKNGRNTTN